MPNVVGQNLSAAQLALQAAGVLVPSAIGYFGSWPIGITWVVATATQPTLSGPTRAPFYDVVTAQSPAANTTIAANGAVTLTVTNPTGGVAYP